MAMGKSVKPAMVKKAAASKKTAMKVTKKTVTKEISAMKTKSKSMKAVVVSVDAKPTSTKPTATVICTCIKEKNGKLRIRVCEKSMGQNSGYDPSWNCQFPRSMREEGATYAVESLQKAPNGNFYCAFGEIRRIVGNN